MLQILLSTPHGGFSETSINSTGNQKKKKKKKKRKDKYHLPEIEPLSVNFKEPRVFIL